LLLLYNLFYFSEENVLYYKNGLKITFDASNENPIIVVLKTKYQADPSYVIDKINLLVAVPKVI